MIKLYKQQFGLSLIELMIAITLGAFIIIGAIQAYLGSRQASVFTESITEIQENSRFIFDQINLGTRQAADMGCPARMVRNANKNTVIAPPIIPFTSIKFNSVVKEDSGAGDVWFTHFYRGIEGTTGAAAGAAGQFLFSKSAKAGSDVLIVHKIDTSTLSDVALHAGTTFTTSAAHGIDGGENNAMLAIAANCLEASLFMVSGVDVNLTGVNVSHAVAATGDYDNCSTGIGGAGAEEGSVSCAVSPGTANKFFGAGSTLAKVTTAAYFVSSTDGLMRLTAGDRNAQELAEGVEQMILRFGVDTDADGIANQYKTTATVTNADWVDVVTIRIGLIMKSSSANILDGNKSITNCNGSGPSPSDRSLRRCVQSTINIRSRGGQNI